MRNPKTIFKITSLLWVLLQSQLAFAVPWEVIVSDEIKTMSFKYSEITAKCYGNYEDEYNSQGWAEDEYRITVNLPDEKEVLFWEKIDRTSGNCPEAVENLKNEALQTNGIIRRTARRQLVNATYTVIDHGTYCRRYSYIRYQIDFLKGVIIERRFSSGRLKITNESLTPGKCPGD